MTLRFTVNGVEREFGGDAEMPLLWYLRDHARLTGTKFGCGRGICGACTVLVDGQPQRSCMLPVGSVGGRQITTIEGLGVKGLHAVQQAWLDEDVAQCGYCQAGQILAAVALLERVPDPSPRDIDSITNLCRCGTYVRIRRAIARAARGKTG
jgi:isoquinoline 1-oxidoreductase subunit alpha